MRTARVQIGCLLAVAVAAGLTGCAGTAVAPPAAAAGVALHGIVMGGQQPVTGTAIQLFAPGTTGYGSAATSLLTSPVATDANGNFSITGLYTCPSASTPVYLLATGGNPGLAAGTNNSALSLMVLLGPCGALTPSTGVTISELTTVAAVYALGAFMADGTHVGSSSTNMAGIAGAFTTAASLVTRTGQTPGSVPSIATVPVAELNTLADMVATCVNSTGSTTAGSACGQLFAQATPSGGSVPADTVTALLDVARNPGHNVSALFNLVTPNGPFQPVLTVAPPDWTVGINYSAAAFRTPADLAVDSGGKAWVIGAPGTLSNGSSTVSALTTAGVVATYPQQYTNFGNLALDAADNLWLTDTNHSNVVELTQSGTRVGAFSGGGITGPGPIAFDPAGNAWVVNNQATVSRLNASGTAVSPTAGYATGGTSGPTALAIDAAGQVWTADGSANMITKLSNAGVKLAGSPFSASGLSSPSGIAIDSAGRALVANLGNSTVTRFAATGTPPASANFSGAGLNAPLAIAVDGAGAAWLTNSGANTVAALNADGSAQSGTSGYGAAFLTNPYRLALDGAGNVWVANLGTKIAGTGTVTQLVGAGSPVVTPLAAAVAQGKVATRP